MRPRIETLYAYMQRERGAFKPFDKLSQRHYEKDFRFLQGNVPSIGDNIYRYALTVEINEVKRTFVLVTFESNKKKIKSFFDKALKQIKDDPALLRKFVLAKAKPTDMTIKYGD